MRKWSAAVWLVALITVFGTGMPAFLALAGSGACAKVNRVADWFAKYDEIRHTAQMSDSERERSRRLMTQGLTASLFGSANSAQDKAAAASLLQKMVDRYARAQNAMNNLPQISETKKLHRGYQQYFSNASSLFSDYLKVQSSLMATDGKGNPLVAQLPQRKADLEALDAANKDLDARIRDKYNIAPYAY